MKILEKIFYINETFDDNELILKHKVVAMLYLSLIGGIGVSIFSIYRYMLGNTIVGAIQFIFGLLLFYGFYRLKRDKKFYKIYSIIIFIMFFIYIHVIFFYVPENSLNILWIISAPVLIFFFLDRDIGTLFLVLLVGFILYLIYVEYPYTVPEYITLFFVLITTALVMYRYEKLKDIERARLLEYNKRLKKDIKKHTYQLHQLNNTLQQKVDEEVTKRIAQEQMLLMQSRMASMGQMIDAIAHQWRQPLMNINAVLMNIDRGIENSEKPDLLQEKILDIFQITSHMSNTIEDFRNLLKIEQNREKFTLDELLNNVIKMMKSTLKSIDLKKSCSKDLLVNVCKSELSQVLIIILSNSAEMLKIKKVMHKNINITVEVINEQCIITISDSAGGIDRKNIDKIFDPYFTTKKQTGGTGLGLYIARIIVEHNMKGKILVRNSKDGAVFKIIIPLG